MEQLRLMQFRNSIKNVYLILKNIALAVILFNQDLIDLCIYSFVKVQFLA